MLKSIYTMWINESSCKVNDCVHHIILQKFTNFHAIRSRNFRIFAMRWWPRFLRHPVKYSQQSNHEADNHNHLIQVSLLLRKCTRQTTVVTKYHLNAHQVTKTDRPMKLGHVEKTRYSIWPLHYHLPYQHTNRPTLTRQTGTVQSKSLLNNIKWFTLSKAFEMSNAAMLMAVCC